MGYWLVFWSSGKQVISNLIASQSAVLAVRRLFNIHLIFEKRLSVLRLIFRFWMHLIMHFKLFDSASLRVGCLQSCLFLVRQLTRRWQCKLPKQFQSRTTLRPHLRGRNSRAVSRGSHVAWQNWFDKRHHLIFRGYFSISKLVSDETSQFPGVKFLCLFYQFWTCGLKFDSVRRWLRNRKKCLLFQKHGLSINFC